MGGVWCCGLGAARFALGPGGGAFPRELSPSVFPLASFHRCAGAQGADPSQPRNLPGGICADTHPGQGWGNDPIRLSPYGVSYPHSIGAFVSERLLDLVAVGALASLAVSMFPEQRLWMFAAIACIVIVTLLLRSRLLSLIGRRAAGSSVAGHAANLVATVRFLLSGRRVAVVAPLSLMAWMAQGVSLYLIVHALGYELTASTVIAIYCLSILAGAASFIPGGLGATEAAIVLLLSAAGVGQTDAITASLVSRSLTLWLAVGIGVVAMIRAAFANKQHCSAPGQGEA